MPILPTTYTPSRIFKNPDISTIYAAKLRAISVASFERERLELKDGDFVDLDWNTQPEKKSQKISVLLHGLAGNAQRPYMKGMAKIFLDNGWDVLRMNFRGCSHEPNRLYKSYHAGATHDLKEVIDYILSLKQYTSISLIGFSLGANVILKYLGENKNLPKPISAAVGISVPCDLAGSLGAINKRRNFVYSKRFLLTLKNQLRTRSQLFPEQIEKSQISACTSLRDIDELYTSKAHGFKDADDYYGQNSSLQFLNKIQIPTLILSAANDSFLSSSSYPFKEATHSEYLYLEVPKYGGHVGFVENHTHYYHEKRTLNFIESQLKSSGI